LSKPDDIALSDPAANQRTPAPVPVAVNARVERSGSIAITSGDFTTPMVRKRTTTRPRGLPQVDNGANVPTPPPVTNGKPIPETPRPSAVREAVAPPPIPEASRPSAVREAAAPPPPPEPPLHRQASLLREAELGSGADQVTPPPAPLVGGEAPLSPDAEPDPGPTPPPEPIAASAPLVSAAPEDSAPLPVETVDSGAIPVQTMHEADSERNLSPLAHTLAHIAEAQRQVDPPAEAEDVAHVDDLELVDAPLEPAPAHPVARPPARPPAPPPPPTPPAPSAGTPPPIPASLLKLPGNDARTKATPADGVATGDLRLPMAGLPIVPEALAERPRRAKRSKPWFEEIFDEDYLRTLPFMTAGQTMKEVAFIESSLQCPPNGEVLDVACGYGRHAIELVQRGLRVTGLDLSLPLLIRAADEAQRRSVSVNFVHADMREMPFDRKFDCAYSMLTSFGYFEEDGNLKVAEGIARALKPGGRFLLDVINRDYVVADLPARIWWEGTGCVVLEEVDFNFHTSRIVTRRSVVFDDGRQLEQEISVRAYSLHEIGRLLRQAGFRVVDVSGHMETRGRFFGGTSRNLMVLCEKRTD
jgi:SAM-dependent methyltransferase